MWLWWRQTAELPSAAEQVCFAAALTAWAAPDSSQGATAAASAEASAARRRTAAELGGACCTAGASLPVSGAGWLAAAAVGFRACKWVVGRALAAVDQQLCIFCATHTHLALLLLPCW